MRASRAFGLVTALWTAGPGNTLTFAFNYGATDLATPLAALGLLTTADTVNADGGYNIISISGTIDGDLIIALTPNPTPAAVSTSPDGLFTYDNVVFALMPSFSNAGVIFTSAGGFEYNLFSDSAKTYELYQAAYGTYMAHSVGTLVLADVPEPTTWALMLTGLAMVGFVARRRRLSHHLTAPGEMSATLSR